jgi:hypothetical protein
VQQSLRAVFVTIFLLGSIPALTALVDENAVTARISANKPGGIDGCIPVGVKTDPDGTVWAVENCNGTMVYNKMGRR